MPQHSNGILPECRESHDNLKFMVITACGFFISYIVVATTLTMSNFNSLRDSDNIINAGRAAGRLEIERSILDLRKENVETFSLILQRLSSIEAILKKTK